MNKKIVTVLSLALASAIVGNANAAEDIYKPLSKSQSKTLITRKYGIEEDFVLYVNPHIKKPKFFRGKFTFI